MKYNHLDRLNRVYSVSVSAFFGLAPSHHGQGRKDRGNPAPEVRGAGDRGDRVGHRTFPSDKLWDSWRGL